MLRKVLLATDGSKDAALAARAAADVCEGTGAELHVVHVWFNVLTARLRPFMRSGWRKREDGSPTPTSWREGQPMRYLISPSRSGRISW